MEKSKKQTATFSKSHSALLIKRTCFTSLIFVLFTISLKLRAQDVISGAAFTEIGVDYFSSGNGHGAFIAPTLVLNKNFNSISLSPMIQKKSMELGGIKLKYVRNLTGGITNNDDDEDFISTERQIQLAEFNEYRKRHKDLFQMNFFTYAQYNGPLELSDNSVNEEQILNKGENVNWSEVRVRTVEIGTGFELQYNISNMFSLKTYVGLGLYHHCSSTYTFYNGATAASLNIGIALNMTINRKYTN